MYRILIVEDDFDISELLQSWLPKPGIRPLRRRMD